MKKEKKVWAMTFIVPWLLAPGILQAQHDSTSSVTLSEVVVTATKFPKNISETGKVLSVIDHDDLLRSGSKDLAQVLDEQVGITVTGSNSNPGKDKALSLQGASNEYTLILIDGIPLSDPTSLGGAYDLRMIPLANVDRIEILRGSQSSLYGSDAVAGVVNIITHAKAEHALEGTGGFSYGSYDTYHTSLSVGGTTDHLDYNFGINRAHSGGVSEAMKPDTTSTSFDRDPFTQQGFTGSVDLRPSGRVEITPYFRYSTFDGKYDAGGFTDSKLDSYSATLTNPGIRSIFKLRKGTVDFLYGYERSKRAYMDDYGNTAYDGNFHTGDLFINYSISNRVTFLTGINAQQSALKNDQDSKSMNLISPYASLYLHESHNVSVEIGGRYNIHSIYGSNSTFSFNPSWLIHNRFKIFYNLSSGFKAPVLSQFYGPSNETEDLQPEKSLSQDAGVQLLMLNNKLSLRVVGFLRRTKDVIQYVPLPDFLYAYVNRNKQNDKGLELEAEWNPVAHLHIIGSYAYLDGKITQRDGAGDSTYFNLFRKPKQAFDLSFNYRFNEQLTTVLSVKYVGDRRDLYFDSNDYQIKPVDLHEYALVNLYIGYSLAHDALKLFVEGRNILDKAYAESYGYSAQGFNANVGISISVK